MTISMNTITVIRKQTKFIFLFFLFVLSIYFQVNAQNTSRKILNFPDILGYKTLKCDFHMHTVFSDGTVWPTVRVEEAWQDGLDVIAITDHLGHHSKNRVDADNFNSNYEIAKPVADKLGLILVRGSEITTKTNYGHLNALFLKDIKQIDKENEIEDIKAAISQGAFITWNHPGKRQLNDIPVWNKEQDEIFQKGWLNGIEIINRDYYYPLAFTWAIDKKLTIFANSDVHQPISFEYNYLKGEHRPMTLVFAKDTSLSSIKDALIQHRTLAYYKNLLYGQEEYLKALFNASIVVQNPVFSIDADSENDYFNHIRIQNNSCFDFEIELSDADKILKLTSSIILPANSVTVLDIKPVPRDIKGDKEYILKYKVKNMFKSADENIVIELPIKIKFI